MATEIIITVIAICISCALITYTLCACASAIAGTIRTIKRRNDRWDVVALSRDEQVVWVLNKEGEWVTYRK